MKVAVIGAGPSGLCAAKEIKQAIPDANVIIYESADCIGGIFSKGYDQLNLVNNPMLINFSDFPADWTLPELKMWTADEYVKYLGLYAKNNNIDELIQHNCKVIKAQFNNNVWSLLLNDCGTEFQEFFNYLVVCTGSNYLPEFPELSGQAQFQGDVIHASTVRDPSVFQNKRILLIGLGETGSDLSELIAEHASTVNVSVRNGPGYLIPRYHDGIPTDLDTSKLYHSLPYVIDESRLGWLLRLKRKMENRRIKSRFDRAVQRRADELNSHWAEYRRPGPFRRASTKNCGFIHAELSGKAILRPAVTHLTEDSAFFADGSYARVDTIIACTGYRQAFPFLDEALQTRIKSSNSLYNYMFPPGLEKQIAFIGYVRPAIGTVPVLAEMQSRLLALYLKGTIRLPAHEQMVTDVRAQQALSEAQFPSDFERLGQLVDYYGLLKKLAGQIGVMPKQYWLLIHAPRIWVKVNFSFLCPSIFRLHGPGNTYPLSSDVIKKLPTMPLSILGIELLIFLICKIISIAGIKKIKMR